MPEHSVIRFDSADARFASICTNGAFHKGKFLFSFAIPALPAGSAVIVGMATQAFSAYTAPGYVGCDLQSWGYRSDGVIIHNGEEHRGDVQPFGAGKEVQLEVDFSVFPARAQFMANNIRQGPCFRDVTNKRVRAAISLTHNTAQVRAFYALPFQPVLVEPDGFADDRLHRSNISYVRNQARPYNICVMGERGAGKSAFINTLITAFSKGRQIQQPALSLNEQKHVSRKLVKFAIDGSHEGLRIWDTWGWQRTNYKGGIFTAILRGNCKNNFEMPEDGDDFDFEGPNVNKNPTPADAVHGFIFVLDLNEAKEAPADYWKSLSEFRDQLLKKGVLSVVFLFFVF